MALISVNNFFYVCLGLILVIISIPIFIIIFDIGNAIFFSILDCFIYLPKGFNKIKEAIIKEWKSLWIITFIKKYKK